MPKAQRPSILIVFPSSFYYPEWMERVELKTSQLLLASYLSQFYSVQYADFEVSIGRPNVPIQIKRYERNVRDFLSKQDFDILAISCWTSLSYQATLKTARICRELYPDKLIVVGGYHPSARPQEFETPDQLIDYVICGEGELALKEITESYQPGQRPAGTQIIQAPLFTEEHFVPCNWDLVDQFISENFPQGIPIAYVYLSRGCPFGCSFCMEPVKGRRWRAYTPQQAVANLMTAVEKCHARSLSFADACFGMRPDWRKEFLRLFVEMQPQFWVSLETRPEYLDEDDIKRLSNLKVEVQFGVESCSAEMLTIMQKSRQPVKFLAKFRQVSRLLSEYRVLHRANLIFNHPGETRRTLEETFTFIDAELQQRNSTLFWASHGYMHFPGSEIDRHRAQYEERYGCRFLVPEWWKEESDQYLNSMQVIPSNDLADSPPDLWQQLVFQREEQMKSALSPKAFRFAASQHFLHWKNDARFRQT